MTLDLTKPVQTRDGRKARIICTDVQGPSSGAVLALILNHTLGGTTSETPVSYNRDGYFLNQNGTDKISTHSLDLVNPPIKTETFGLCTPDGCMRGFPFTTLVAAIARLNHYPAYNSIVKRTTVDGKLYSLEIVYNK